MKFRKGKGMMNSGKAPKFEKCLNCQQEVYAPYAHHGAYLDSYPGHQTFTCNDFKLNQLNKEVMK